MCVVLVRLVCVEIVIAKERIRVCAISESLRSQLSVPQELIENLSGEREEEHIVSVEIPEEKTKIIQKEAIQTGSVSSVLRSYFLH